MKKKASIGIDKLSDPLILMASAIVIAILQIIIAIKDWIKLDWLKIELENKLKIINVLKNIITDPS